MAEKKIALIIAGGVSLGTYEAGVLTELLYLIDTYNSDDSSHNYVIDVITGGSAGSMNAALLARISMHGYDKREILHKLWVNDADIMELLKYPSDNSLFGGEYQRRMGEKYLSVENDIANPASFAPAQLKLSFALSNMVGVDYGYPYNFAAQTPLNNNSADQFTWTFFSDYLGASLIKNTAPIPEQWELIKQGGIASGGFPVAFAPSFVQRQVSDFPGSIPSTTLPGSHAISDGGMFDNEPVKKAIELAREIDGDQPNTDRRFILIDPSVNTSKLDPKFTTAAGVSNIFDNIKRLLVMALGEAEAKDWLKAGKVNHRIEWQEKLIDSLPDLINTIDEAQVDDVLSNHQQRSNKIVVEMENAFMAIDTQSPGDYLTQSIERIRSRFSTSVLSIGIPGESERLFSNRRNIFLHMAFEISAAGSLTSKSFINLHLIGADKDKTAGEGFFALSGFFEEHWREHDYRLGRRVAAKLIPEFLEEAALPREAGAAYDNEPEWGDLTKVTIGDANKNSRKAFCKRAMQLVETVLKKEPFNLNWLFRKVAKMFIKKFVRKALEL